MVVCKEQGSAGKHIWVKFLGPPPTTCVFLVKLLNSNASISSSKTKWRWENKFHRVFVKNRNTVAPWTTYIWTAQVHLRTDFFNSKYYSTAWPVVGWICGCVTTDTREPQIQRTSHVIFHCGEGQHPEPHIAQGSTVHIKSLVLNKHLMLVPSLF